MRRKGFTIIELLIVVAIIAVLATLVITNVAGARQRANDSKVVADMSSAIRIAVLCMNEDGNVNAYVAGNNICSLTNVTGRWPKTDIGRSSGTIGTGAGATNNWQAPSVTITGNTITATVNGYTGTAAANNVRVNCNNSGCQKEVFSGTAWAVSN
ncbi:MAG: Type II secretion system protein G precursor [bacterium ADurb.Bin400]|nr:MAG: Type II secretion system protein G precursor [bacterium ADurb.Bin400]